MAKRGTHVSYLLWSTVTCSGLLVGSTGAFAQASRVDTLMQQLTPQEKITLLAGVDDFYTRPIPRLGIPRIKMTDGPNGARCFGPSTAYPAGVLLAATWDPTLAQREGEQLGRDARARGCHVLLGPGVNLYRHPRNGRNFEYFGEDPTLAGDIAAGYIRGVQSQNVSAVIKHFIANNQETDRFDVSVEADQRTLRERYLAPFHRAIEQSNPGAVMCSYNRINGTFASANHWLLTEVLRDEWKYPGVVMSDWGAVHGTLGPLQGGLDLEMPGPTFLNEAKITPLLQSGAVSQSTIDTKVRRLLTWMDRFGWLDREQTDTSIPQENPDGARVTLDIARAGITLLKNDGVLPFDAQQLKNIVVIGPNAERTPVGGGGSGYTTPFHAVSTLDGLRTALGDERVTLIRATPEDELIAHPGIDGPFEAEYFDNKTLDGDPAAKGTAGALDFTQYSAQANPIATHRKDGKASARFRTTITPKATANYDFYVSADDGVRVKLDDATIIDDWSDHNARPRRASMKLEQGKTYKLTIEYYDAGGETILRFGCGTTPASEVAQQDEQIRSADAVVVCVGFDSTNEAEGSDRAYELPAEQLDVIRRATELNRKTIVVLNAGGSTDVADWIDRAGAFVHTYYGGQEGGTALADVLLGNVNPSGRLPFAWEAQCADLPSDANFGKKGTVEYVEGIFSGYRGMDRNGIAPRFPFGFGLSYTTFTVSDPKLLDAAGDVIRIDADLVNTGPRDGATVVQCYVTPPQANVPRPTRELRAYQRLSLKAGEHRRVELSIPKRDLAYWNPETRSWTVTPGTYTFQLGFNERDLEQKVTAEVE
ncbi:MAG: glycoside hydrolase family 3 C-terminal domain-containing protein [Tepidisphaeraceae bacterium]